MLKIAIIGCGKIADSHAEQIKRISNCEIVAVCDKEELMAKQLFDRFKVGNYFSDAEKMLNRIKPDVVHITTPPQSHFALGKLCLENGCNVYIEKPFTTKVQQAKDLIEIAKKRNLKITVGHDDQFSNSARRMRHQIKNGFLGGAPVHIESYYCYDLGEGSYARSLLGDKEHWVRKLPGQLLQNVISHGIARIAEFIESDNPIVYANGFTSSKLKSMSEQEIIDEVRVIINDKDKVTAYFTFSSQMRPQLHQMRIFGPKNGLLVDHHKQMMIKLYGKMHKSYLEKFVPSINFSTQYMSNFFTNLRYFLKNDFHMKSGMKYLIENFYNSIVKNTQEPIKYKEIILTSLIMEKIFNQIYGMREKRI